MDNLFTMIIGLAGGLGLFLYGMKIMGEGLENAAGDKLKVFFEKITSNPVKGIFTGAIVTSIIQSSSATTVMVVGFVNAGIMTLYQAAGVIFGANIGTTITGQLVAFNLTAIAPLFVAIGALIVLFAKGKKNREIGNIILGFGILFMGMALMKTSMKPLSHSPFFKNLITTIGINPLIGVLVGLLMTATVQSSSATIGILIALASSGAIDLNVTIPILLGDNIGTCVTALLSSIGTSKTARKAALIHLIFNLTGTIIIIVLMTPFMAIVRMITPNEIPRQIANAHTLFNIANVLIQFPFIKLLIKLVNKIIPGEDEHEKMGVKYIDERLLETPVIAVGQTIKEIIRMASKAQKNLKLSMDAFQNNNAKEVHQVYENEKLINLLEDEITNYLVKLSSLELPKQQHNLITSMFHVVNDIERIGDHAENVADLTLEKIEKNLKISAAAEKELQSIYEYTYDAVKVSIQGFRENNPSIAKNVIAIEERIDTLEDELRNNHIKRLNEQVCSAHIGAIFLDILSNFERIGDHSLNIAEIVMKSEF